MGYIQDNLMPNERIVVRGRNHISLLIRPAVVALVSIVVLIVAVVAAASKWYLLAFLVGIFGGLMLIGAVSGFIGSLIAYLGNEVAVTTRRVIGKFGVFRRSTLEFPFAQIESVAFEQGFVDRLLGGAQIRIRGSGSAWVETPLLANFREFRTAAMEGVEAVRSGRTHPAEAAAASVGFQGAPGPASAPTPAAAQTPSARN